MWWAREDSNLQPSGYEPLALTIELRARRLAGGADLEHFAPKRKSARPLCMPPDRRRAWAAAAEVSACVMLAELRA
jgi:hypothetical protein